MSNSENSDQKPTPTVDWAVYREATLNGNLQGISKEYGNNFLRIFAAALRALSSKIINYTGLFIMRDGFRYPEDGTPTRAAFNDAINQITGHYPAVVQCNRIIAGVKETFIVAGAATTQEAKAKILDRPFGSLIEYPERGEMISFETLQPVTRTNSSPQDGPN
jgi:hypothetical protein